MQLTIEFADNGIILRDPDCEDDVTLALTGKGMQQEGYGYDHTEEFKAIGRRVYEWLTEVVVAEYSGYWTATGAELNIVATLTGRRHDGKDL